MYFEGKGVEKNILAAYAWYTIAAANGYTKAAKWKTNTGKQLTPAQLAEAGVYAREMVLKYPKLIQKKP